MSCPACGGEAVGASSEPSGGTTFRCHGCQHTWTSAAHAERPKTSAPAKPRATEAIEAEPTRMRQRSDANAQTGGEPINPIRAMRARKKWLEGQIRQLSKLQTELDELNRILSAATSKPGAVLRGAVRLASAK